MKFRSWLNELEMDRTEKIKKVFEKVPGDNPKSIADYVVKTLNSLGVKSESGNATYLSGPMTNLPDFNWPVFIFAEKYLSGKVFNPAKPHGSIIKKPKAEFTWGDFMTEDVYVLLKSNKIVVLPGYSNSTGALTEIAIGEKVLKTKAKPFKKVIGEKKYDKFLEDVENQFVKDGNEKEYNSIIKPMLLAKTESEAAKKVKTFIPSKGDGEGKRADEGVVDSIKNFANMIKDNSMKGVLKLIGLIFNKASVKKIVR